MVGDIENVDDIWKSFYIIMGFTMTAKMHKTVSKCQLENDQNYNGWWFRGYLTSTIEFNVLLNRLPMSLYHQPLAVLMFRDPVYTYKAFDFFYRSVACLMVKGLKSHKLIPHKFSGDFGVILT